MNPSRFFFPVVSWLAVAAVLWFFHWTAGSPRFVGGEQSDYYNLLVDGFQDGSLAMKVTPDPWLGVDNTKVRHYLLDASFYDGKYYLYFGVTPALVLIWPWAAITGHDLPEAAAAVVLAGLGYLLSLGWLAALRRHFFPLTGGGYWLLTVVLLGLASGYPVVLRRPMFYEIAIFAGVACSFGGLWCLTLALLRPAQAWRWLAAGSLCAGLAAGSRPTLVPGAVLAVAIAAGWIAWRARAAINAGRLAGLAAAAVLPAGLCGAALAWYNWARFGNPLEFGLLHQLGSNGHGFPFRLKHLVENLSVYYLTPPDFSWFFPFFAPGPKPPGSYQEQVHGQFFNLLVFSGIAAWALIRGWRRDGVREARVIALLGAVWATVALVFVALAWPHANRYMLDFHPVLLAVALPGLWACAGDGLRWRWVARLVAVGGAGLALYNVCTSLQVHGFFKGTHPARYEQLARVTDRLVWPLHRMAGPRFGGLETAVRFPSGQPGVIEPILVAGSGPDADAIMIQYTGPNRGRLLFMHLGHGEVAGEEFDLKPGRVRWLQIHLGTLYPPPWHPWYDTQPPGLARANSRVAAKLDGESVLDRDAACHTVSTNRVSLGRRAGFPIGAERFSGMIQRVRGLGGDHDWLQALQAGVKAVRLTLLLPRERFGAEEPLWLAGERGREVFLSITYVRDGVVRFQLRHPGWPEPRSTAEIAWDYAQPLELLIGLDTPEGGFRMDVDGQPVLDEALPAPVDAAGLSYVGCLPWPVGMSRLMFGGAILEQARLAEAPPPESRARSNLLAGRPVHLEVFFPALEGIPNQPLLTTGITGRGDGLFLEPAGPGQVIVGFDHWGSQPLRSAPVAFSPGAWHHVKVSFGAKVRREVTVRGQLRVELDGTVVLDADADLFPAEPALVFFGANPIGMSTSAAVCAPGTLRVLADRPAADPVTSP